MISRKNKIRLAGAAATLALLAAAWTWWSGRPNPESPKWWLRQALRHVREVGESPADEKRVIIRYAIKRHADTGDFAGTRVLIRDLRSRPFIPRAKRWAGDALRRAGIKIGWLLVPGNLLQPALKSHEDAYEMLAVAQARAGDIKGAQETAALTGGEQDIRFYAMAEIARAQVKAGDLRAAALTCQWPVMKFNISEFTRPMRYEYLVGRAKPRALAALGCALAKAGDAMGAVALSRDMQLKYHPQSAAQIALAIADAGHPELAELAIGGRCRCDH